MEIQNLYSIDIFFQGFFLVLCVTLGLYLVFKDNLQNYQNIDSIKKFSNGMGNLVTVILNTFNFKNRTDDKTPSQYNFGIIPVIIIATFIMGIIGYGIADQWIDSSNKNHFGLKPLWIPKKIVKIDSTLHRLKKPNQKCLDPKYTHKYVNYKNRIRYSSFKEVFNKELTIPRTIIIEKLYFHSKHEIIENKKFYNYIRKSQALAEYSRAFALGFFFILICSFINLLIMIIRIILGDLKNYENGNKNGNKNAKPSPNGNLISISDGVILIFFGISICSITFFANPIYANLEAFDISLLTSCFILFFGCFTLILSIFGRFRKLKFSFFIYSIIYVIAILGYFSSGKIWVGSEQDVSLKVFGIYKSTYLNQDSEEFKFSRDVLKLNTPDNLNRKNNKPE